MDAKEHFNQPALLKGVACFGPDQGDHIPSFKGSYILILGLKKPLALAEKFGDVVLLPGRYCYFGSARGPGGVRARLSRHLTLHQQKSCKRHWHIDEITSRIAEKQGFAFEHISECELRSLLDQQTRLETPIDGFGASDCIKCNSHFVRLSQ